MHVRVNVFSHMLCAISFPHKRKATASWRCIGGSSVLGSVRVSFMVVSYVRGCVYVRAMCSNVFRSTCVMFWIVFNVLGSMCHTFYWFSQCFGLPVQLLLVFSDVSVRQKQKTMEKKHIRKHNNHGFQTISSG